jgi:putative phage-type endonuclease
MTAVPEQVVTEPGLAPGSPEWRRVITASKVAAILGLSPWQSPYSLWREMHGDVEPEGSSDVKSRGQLLEPAVLGWWRMQHADTLDWHDHVCREQQTFRLGDWAAATPDMSIHPLAPQGERPGREILGPVALVEAKTTSLDWGGELPAYYLCQVIWQMHVSGARRCYVPVLGPRLRFEEYVVEYGDYAEDAAFMEARCREFYDSLAADEPPPLDDTVATYEAVRKVHPDIDRGVEVELTYDEALAFADAIHDEENAVAHARLMRSTVIERMGRAQFAKHNGVKVARRQSRGDAVTFVPLAKHPNQIPEPESA